MKLLVYGSGVFGGVARILLEECGHEFAGFIDDVSSGPEVLGGFDAVVRSHSANAYGCVNAVGYKDLVARQRVTDRVLAAGYAMPALVHPRAVVGASSRVAAGAFVMAGALVDAKVEIGAHVVIWGGAVVSHDSVVGANTFLSPNSTICGCCRIGPHCFVGAAASVLDHAEVPGGTRIKAGERYVTWKK